MRFDIGHIPLKDKETVRYLDNVIFKNIDYKMLDDVSSILLDQTWRDWLLQSTYNKIIGLEKFLYSAFVPGTTDAFGEFISRYPEKRIRVSRSDFILTKILSKTYQRNLVYLEEEKLKAGDCLIISLPYSGNGSYHPDWPDLLNHCDEYDIPVFVDGAYFGISHGIEYPLNRNCIKDFTTSLSKNLAGNSLRLGIRFTKDLIDDGITAGMLGSDVFDRLGAYITIELLKNFSHDWTVNKYLDIQNKICHDHRLEPTNTLTLALGSEEMEEFKRGDYIRVSISNELSRLS